MLEEARRKYFEASSAVYQKVTALKMSETAKDRIINSDEDVRPFYNEYQDYRNKREIVAYTISNIEDIVFMLSREISRRGADFEEDTRNHNVGRK